MAEENGQAEEILEAVGAVRALDTVHARIGGYFHRREMRERVRRYLVGLLGHVERKNSWQLAEAFGEAGPQGGQRLFTAADWDAEGGRDVLRTYVVEHLGGAASGGGGGGETGFLKKGGKPAGGGRRGRRAGGPAATGRGWRSSPLPGPPTPGPVCRRARGAKAPAGTTGPVWPCPTPGHPAKRTGCSPAAA